MKAAPNSTSSSASVYSLRGSTSSLLIANLKIVTKNLHDAIDAVKISCRLPSV